MKTLHEKIIDLVNEDRKKTKIVIHMYELMGAIAYLTALIETWYEAVYEKASKDYPNEWDGRAVICSQVASTKKMTQELQKLMTIHQGGVEAYKRLSNE